MAKKKLEAVIAQRPFIMIFLDFLKSDVIQNCYQRIIYIYLKLFADENGQCFPSLKQLSKLTKISVNKIKSTINEMIHLGLVQKERRIREDGGTDSNLYTINDTCETWGAKPRSDGKRPFVKVYKDFLENDKLDNFYQKLVYIYLGKYADKGQRCYPSVKTLARAARIGISKVKSTIKELCEKGMIDKKNRWRKNGGKDSNLYTLLYSLKERFKTGNGEEINNNKEGYGAVNEKGLDSEPAKEQNQALTYNELIDYTKPNPQTCQGQETEKYPMEKIREYFQYDNIVIDNPDSKDDIDAVMNVLYDTLNTTKLIITVDGEAKSSQVVIGQLMKLNEWSIMYAIQQFKSQRNQRIKHPKAYMRSILYNAAAGGFELDLENQVAYNEAHWREDMDEQEEP